MSTWRQLLFVVEQIKAAFVGPTREETAQNQRAYGAYSDLMSVDQSQRWMNGDRPAPSDPVVARSDREDMDYVRSLRNDPAYQKLVKQYEPDPSRGPMPWEMRSQAYTAKSDPVPTRPVQTPFPVRGTVAKTAHDHGLALIKAMARRGD